MTSTDSPQTPARYRLAVTYISGYSDIGTCDTFAELSEAIDRARETPGFVGYRVSPVEA